MRILSPHQARKVGRSIAAVRLAVGAACLIRPSLARAWLGNSARSPAAMVLSRSMAGRDMALGYGTYRAKQAGLSTWLVLSAVADTVDATGTVLARGHIPKARCVAVAAFSALAAAAGLASAASLRDPPGPS